MRSEAGTPVATNDGEPASEKLATVACASPETTPGLPGTADVEVALADDTLNRLLWAAWRAGAGVLQTAPPAAESTTAMGLGEMEVQVEMLLPPVVTGCGGSDLSVHIGDVRAVVETDVYGTPLEVTMHFAVEAELDVVQQDGAVGIEPGAVKTVDWDATVSDSNMLAWADLLSNVVADHAIPDMLAAFDPGGPTTLQLPDLAVGETDKVLIIDAITRIGTTTLLTGAFE